MGWSMISKATVKYAIISPKKVWRITRELGGKPYKLAMEILRELTPKAARIVEKLLKSCFYNGLQKDNNLSEDDVMIKHIFVTKGPYYKRMNPRAQGRADVIKKRTSHINVMLSKKGEE
jgi:large subunit ribosomal protein L22